MTSALDQKGLEAARKARDEAWPLDSLEAIIRAYLSTVILAEIAGVVEELRKRKPFGGPSSDPLDLEAATLIERLAASQAETERRTLERAARTAYRVCAETRHVTLGDKCSDAIRALIDQPNTEGANNAQ